MFSDGTEKLVIDGLCFTKGTKIKTDLNTVKNIEDISTNDQVLSYDHKQKKNVRNKVKRLFKRVVKRLAVVGIGSSMFLATPEHPFFANGNYTPANELQIGDSILDCHGHHDVVTSLSFKDTLAEVYNFEVENAHNYYVGEHGYLVHNKCRLLDIENIIDGVDKSLIESHFKPFSDNLMATGASKESRADFTEAIMDLGDDTKITNFVKDFAGASKDDLPRLVNKKETVGAWKKLSDAGSPLSNNIDELTDVSKHLDDINSYPGGYSKWKTDIDEIRKMSSEDVLEEILNRGTQDKIIGDYSIDMVSDKIGSNYIVNGFNVNLVDGAKESITGVKNVLKSLETEAINSGAKIFTFRLHAIKNDGFLSPRLWELLGCLLYTSDAADD